MSLDFTIPAEHPALAGHFPGQPIVPGALLLEQLSNVLAQHIGQPLYSAKQLRFTAPLAPTQKVDVEYTEKTAGDYRFTAHANNQLIAKGVLSSTISTNLAPSIELSIAPGGAAIATKAASLYDKLPHQGDICLLDSIISYDTESIYCLSKQAASCPLRHNTGLPAWASLEYAAQALACHGMLNARDNGEPDTITSAWVIGVKHLHCQQQYLPQADNEAYTIAARILAHQPGIASYEFSLANNNTYLAFGRLNVAFDTSPALKKA